MDIKQQDPIAAILLQQWAYFNNGDLWYELLKGKGVTKPGWLAKMTRDKLRFYSTMRVLCNHGLAEAGRTRQSHRGKMSMLACIHG
jgi:hypothetical protein